MLIQSRIVSRSLPPSENGDTLRRDEFDSPYHAILQANKPEWIEAVINMPSPVSAALPTLSYGSVRQLGRIFQ